MNLPAFSSYGQYASGNYGAHAMQFSLPNGIEFYYSYQTLVAFRSPFSGLMVRENAWSTTTGKHLNWIDGGAKKERLTEERFSRELDVMLAHYGISDEGEEGSREALRQRLYAVSPHDLASEADDSYRNAIDSVLDRKSQ